MFKALQIKTLSSSFYSVAQLTTALWIIANILFVYVTWGVRIGFRAETPYVILLAMVMIIQLALTYIMIIYFRLKKAYLPLVTFSLFAFSSFALLVLVYAVYERLLPYSWFNYAVAFSFVYATLILFGTSLLFSKMRHQKWILAFALITLLSTGILFYTFFNREFIEPFSFIHRNPNAYYINWYIQMFCPIFLFFHFRKEMKKVDRTEDQDVLDMN